MRRPRATYASQSCCASAWYWPRGSKSEELGNRAAHELNVHGRGENLPSYRLLDAIESKGALFGPLGARLSGYPTPPAILPEHVGAAVVTVRLCQGIAEHEELMEAVPREDCRMPWPGNLVLAVADRIVEAYTLVQACQVVRRASIIWVLDRARTSVLGFALDIEKQNPAAGEAAPDQTPAPGPLATHVFNNRTGLLQADEDGYYDQRGKLILRDG